MLQCTEEIDLGELSDEQERNDRERDRAEHGPPAESFEACDGGNRILVLADQLAANVGDAPAGFAHGGPAPGGEGERLQDGEHGFLVLGRIGGTKCRNGIGGPDAPRQRRQQLRDIQPPHELARAGQRRVEGEEDGRPVGDAEVLRPQVAMGHPGIVEFA